MAHNTFMSHIQTRPGLGILRDNFMAALEVSPWSNKTLVLESLEDESEPLIPIYSIRYDWITQGKVRSYLV